MAIEAHRGKIEDFDFEATNGIDNPDNVGLNLAQADLPPIIESGLPGTSNVIIDFSRMLERINAEADNEE